MVNVVLPLRYLGGEKTREMSQHASLNTLPPRATLIPFASTQDGLPLDRDKSVWFANPNGEWQFKIRSAPDQATSDELTAD